MNFKKIVSATLFTLLASNAIAKIDDSVATSGSGELFLTIIDSVGERSYTRDLGISLSDFISGVSIGQIWSFTNDTNLNTFITETSNFNQLEWNIGALDGTGLNRYLSSIGLNSVMPSFSNFTTARFNDNSDIYLANVNTLGSHPNTNNGSSIATIADGLAYAGSAVWGGNFGGVATGFNNLININDKSELILFEQWSTTTANRFLPGNSTFMTFNDMKYQVDYDGASFNIAPAPVPEPETYALMGLGLIVLGSSLCRKNAKK